METLLILRGISGAGKTTFVENLKKHVDGIVHASADFIHMDMAGNYNFNPAKLGEGHGLCFRTAIRAMEDRAGCVIVDNTHTMNWELAPYVLAGQAFGYRTAIVRLEIDPATAAARNVHGVPQKSIDAMTKRFQDPMNFWPREYKFTNPTQAQVWEFYREFTK